MKPPIFVCADDGVTIFSTVADAESYLEPIDVRKGEYSIICDSEGNRLHPDIILGRRGRVFPYHVESVQLRALKSTPRLSSSELRKILKEFLAGTGVPLNHVEESTLQQLVKMASRFAQR